MMPSVRSWHWKIEKKKKKTKMMMMMMMMKQRTSMDLGKPPATLFLVVPLLHF